MESGHNVQMAKSTLGSFRASYGHFHVSFSSHVPVHFCLDVDKDTRDIQVVPPHFLAKTAGPINLDFELFLLANDHIGLASATGPSAWLRLVLAEA